MQRPITDKDIEEIERMFGIELMECQKEMLRKTLSCDKAFVCMPPHVGYIQAMNLARLTRLIFGFGEKEFKYESTRNDL